MEIELNLEELKATSTHLKKTINTKKAALSADGRLDLQKLMDDKFLRCRMNALALKQRIHDRLRQRKFELEALDRAYRSSVNRMSQSYFSFKSEYSSGRCRKKITTSC